LRGFFVASFKEIECEPGKGSDDALERLTELLKKEN
jgi:hypothetical protein